MTDEHSPEAVARVVNNLRSRNMRHDASEAADMLEALAAKLAEAEADNDDLRVNMDADLKTMCRESDALKAALRRAEAAEARLATAEEILRVVPQDEYTRQFAKELSTALKETKHE